MEGLIARLSMLHCHFLRDDLLSGKLDMVWFSEYAIMIQNGCPTTAMS